MVAAQRGGPGSKAGGQPVRQPLPGAQQHPPGVGGMRSAQSGQGPLGLGGGTVTASPQPAPRSAGSGGQLDREIPTPVPCPCQLWTVASPSSSSVGIEASTAFVHTSTNRHHRTLSESTRRLSAGDLPRSARSDRLQRGTPVLGRWCGSRAKLTMVISGTTDSGGSRFRSVIRSSLPDRVRCFLCVALRYGR